MSKRKSKDPDYNKMLKFFKAIARALESLSEEERKRLVKSFMCLYVNEY